MTVHSIRLPLTSLPSLLLVGFVSLATARESAPLLAVSQTDANQVTLLSLSENERTIATIPLACKGPFGLSFTSHRDWLYVACWDQAKVALIDVTAGRPTQIFNSGKWPAWIEARNHSNETWISDEAKGIVS